MLKTDKCTSVFHSEWQKDAAKETFSLAESAQWIGPDLQGQTRTPQDRWLSSRLNSLHNSTAAVNTRSRSVYSWLQSHFISAALMWPQRKCAARQISRASRGSNDPLKQNEIKTCFFLINNGFNLIPCGLMFKPRGGLSADTAAPLRVF